MDEIDCFISRVEQLTDIAMSNDGIRKAAEILREPIKVRSLSRSDVMRGIAEQALPGNWDWEVVEFVGGGCRILVKSTG